VRALPDRAQAPSLTRAAIRTIFAPQTSRRPEVGLGFIADGLSAKHPAVSETLLAAEEDMIAHMAFPREHWCKNRNHQRAYGGSAGRSSAGPTWSASSRTAPVHFVSPALSYSSRMTSGW